MDASHVAAVGDELRLLDHARTRPGRVLCPIGPYRIDDSGTPPDDGPAHSSGDTAVQPTGSRTGSAVEAATAGVRTDRSA
jgi:hypothetical protein